MGVNRNINCKPILLLSYLAQVNIKLCIDILYVYKNREEMNMAFCMYCGKQLEEGEICNCQSNGAAVGTEGMSFEKQQFAEQNQQVNGQYQAPQVNYQEYQEKFNQAKEVSGMYLQQLWAALLGILKSPVSEGKRFAASGDKKLAIGFFSIQAILSGIFSMIICSKINSGMKAFGEVDSEYLFSLPKALLITIIGSMILSFVTAGLLFAGVKIFKGTTTFWNMSCVAAVRSIGISIIVLLSIIVTLLNVSWGIVIFVFAALAGLVFLVPVIQGGATLDENKQVYMVGLIVILSLIVFCILFKLGAPMYVPSSMKDDFADVMDSLNKLNSLSDLF